MTTTVVKTIGATGRDYATHALWIAGAPSNIVTADQVWAGKSYNDAVFTVTSQINISGITTDATRYVDLDAGPGQGWVSNSPPVFGASQSRGVLITCATAYQATLANNIVNFQLHNHQITNTSGSNRAAYSASTGSTTNIVENCIFESTDAASSARYGITRNSLSVITGANSAPAWDCDYSQSVGMANLGAARPSGVTAAGTAYAASSATTPMHNCWSAGFTTHSTAGRFSGSNNATTAGTLSFGSGNVTSLPFTTATFAVVVNTNHDYKLVTGSSLVDAGATDTTDIPAAVDAIGTSRPQGSAWDIGPHELTAGGSIYNVGVAESVTAADLYASLAALVAGQVEAANGNDAPSTKAVLPSAVGETASPADLVSNGSIYPATGSDSVTAADLLDAKLTRAASVPEAAAGADAPSTTAVLPSAQAEAPSLVDAPNSTAVLPASDAETASPADQVGGALVVPGAVPEAGSALDAPSTKAILPSAVGEAVTATDVETAPAPGAETVNESAPLTDLVSAQVIAGGAQAEAAAAGDSVGGGLILPAAVAESAALADLVAAQARFATALVELGFAADLQGARMIMYSGVLEAGTAVDTVAADAAKVAASKCNTLGSAERIRVLGSDVRIRVLGGDCC